MRSRAKSTRGLGWRLKQSLPGVAAAIIAIVLNQLHVWQPLERAIYTAQFRFRGDVPWDTRVVSVNLDDKTIRQLGHYPVPRRYYTALLQKLTQASSNVVVIDVVFSESGVKAEDEQLAAAIAKHGSVVLAQAWDSSEHPWQSIAILQQAAITTGHIAKLEDADGIVRQVALQRQGTPALAIAAIQAYSLIQPRISLPDSASLLWINWSGQTKQAPHYSLIDVLQNRIPAQAFQNKIVVVGATAVGIDPLPTPFDRVPPASGVYLHASAINNLLQHNFLQPPALGWFLVIVLVGGPRLSGILAQRSVKAQLGIWLGLCLGWAALNGVMFRANYWLPTAFPLALFSMTTIAIVTIEHFQLELENRNLQYLATSDELTQIANRRHFDQYLDYEWRRLARNQAPLALILCDVDFFKKFNDHYGHQAGDNCLRLVAAAMRGAVKRPADLVARYGGEEFVVVLPNTNMEEAVFIAEAIRSQVKALKIDHAQSLADEYVSLSLGIASVIPQPDGTAAALVAAADQALYRAKQAGRDRSVVA